MIIRSLGTVLFKRDSGDEVVAQILPASFLRYKRLLEIEKEKKAYLEENKGKSIAELSRNKIAAFAMRTAKELLEFEGGFPGREFFEADDFEFSTLEIASGAFFLTFRNL